MRFFICVLLLALHAHADDSCPTIRLDDSGGSMSQVPVTFQGHVGICYAHAAAQMVDAYRFSHGDTDFSHFTSPLEVAVNSTFLFDPKSDFTDGAYTVCPSVKAVQQSGSCDESWVNELYNAPNVQRADFLNLFTNWEGTFKKFRSQEPKSEPISEVLTRFHDQAETARQQFTALGDAQAERAFPDADKLAAMVALPSTTSAFFQLIEPYCEQKPKLEFSKSITCVENTDIPATEIFQKIRVLLAQPNAQPVAIKICRNIFEQGPAYKGVTPTGIQSDCLYHFPLIIGSQMMNGKCHFLVRNSMGTDDSGYSSAWMPREHGNLWIDEDTLINNTMSMAHLQ